MHACYCSEAVVNRARDAPCGSAWGLSRVDSWRVSRVPAVCPIEAIGYGSDRDVMRRVRTHSHAWVDLVPKRARMEGSWETLFSYSESASYPVSG